MDIRSFCPKPPKPWYTYFFVVILFFCVAVSWVDYIISFLLIKLIILQGRYIYSSILFFLSIFLLISFFVSFLAGVCTRAGSPPLSWEKDVPKKVLELMEKDRDGNLRKCEICEVFKPDRCHHCSSCGKCVLRMDHHCQILNNCVGYHNYKNFLLILFYSSIGGFFGFGTTVEIYSDIFFKDDFSVVNMFITPLGFCGLFIGLAMSLFFLYHIFFQVCMNKTTLESLKIKSDGCFGMDNKYNINPWVNFRQVFGRNSVSDSRTKGLFFSKRISLFEVENFKK